MPKNPDNSVAALQHRLKHNSALDRWITAFDVALKTNFARPAAARQNPADDVAINFDEPLTEKQRKLSASLMRINHTGEVCAQALYTAQALTTKDPELQNHLITAAQEEIDHLDWCRDRLDALDARSSLFNPLWFAGSFAIGLAAGKLGGDKASLGFVVETERQVESHLTSHLDELPLNDLASRAVVKQMKIDEIEHANAAKNAGGIELPQPIRLAMHLAGKVMTSTVRYI